MVRFGEDCKHFFHRKQEEEWNGGGVVEGQTKVKEGLRSDVFVSLFFFFFSFLSGQLGSDIKITFINYCLRLRTEFRGDYKETLS